LQKSVAAAALADHHRKKTKTKEGKPRTIIILSLDRRPLMMSMITLTLMKMKLFLTTIPAVKIPQNSSSKKMSGHRTDGRRINRLSISLAHNLSLRILNPRVSWSEGA